MRPAAQLRLDRHEFRPCCGAWDAHDDRPVAQVQTLPIGRQWPPPGRRRSSWQCLAGRSVMRSRVRCSARRSARTASAICSNSSARARSGDRSKPKACSMSPPCPFLAKRLPFGLSRRTTRPHSTSTARCRRSVAGAMPWARNESCWLEGNTTRPPSPDSSVSGKKLSSALSTASALSVAPPHRLRLADGAKQLPLVRPRILRARLR